MTAWPRRFVDALGIGVAGTAVCGNGAIVYDIAERTVVAEELFGR